MSQADNRFMALALSLGRRGLGQVWPNPAVGAVLVSEGRIVGRGWTQSGGRPHAEAMALAQAGAAARGATAYVTLEPCAHHGKTPPCAEALIKAGVTTVHYALEDPDPRVAGRGAALLGTSGIAVEKGLLDEAAALDNFGYLLRTHSGRPMVTLKLAASFDGRIATATGESRWITGPEARARVHALRAAHDAVLVGGGTARADDPGLTVRGQGDVRQPVRVVASRRLDLPDSGALADPTGKGPLWLVHGLDAEDARIEAWRGRGAECLGVAVGADGQLDPAGILAALGARGLTRVFAEGGGALGASLLSAGLVDELIGFSAGVVLGAEAQPSIGSMAIERLEDAVRFELVETLAVGGDVMHRWRVQRQSPL